MSTEDICKGCSHTYQRLPRAKSKLCCSCRKIKIEAKKSVSRMVANDPPAFQTQKELDEMELTCRECGDAYEVPASIGLSKQCVAKCPTCRKAGKKLANHTRSEAL